jgi:hypothetical protein
MNPAAIKLMFSDRRIAIILVEQHADIALELRSCWSAAQLQKDTATLQRVVGLRVGATA